MDAIHTITDESLARMRESFEAKPEHRRMLNAAVRTQVNELSLRHERLLDINPTVSHKLDKWSVTNQKASGRCWCFAGLNLLRVGTMEKLGLKNFEFSQNWTLFWDKLERANWFLNHIVDTADCPVDERTVQHLLASPIGDGGQWHMFVDVVKKYGLVPKDAMPETASSSATAQMNAALNHLLRRGARDIRKHAGDFSAMQAELERVMDVIYRVLCIHLGVPPQVFEFQWRDKDDAFHRVSEMTPTAFAAEYVTLNLDEYVCLVNDPREGHEYGKTYTVDRLGNVVAGRKVVYLNVPIETMKAATLQTILAGEPVWMGCAVGQMFHRNEGVWDGSLYDYAGVYGVDWTFEKADRLSHGHAQMSHAMLFTGADVVDESDGSKRARRWRVENSWGDQGGKKGFYTMDDSWYDDHMYEIAVHRSHLDPVLLEALEKEPVVLPPWDPMGALAG